MNIEPLHFGPGGRLFGLRNEAAGAPRRTAVLLCPPWGPEYMRSYRALHLLAGQLAQRGFETLRFDYSDTGDSGDTGTPALAQWLEDIGHALRELRELSGAAEVCVLGLRLGGLLAAQAREQGQRIEHLVLWDTPDSGELWLWQLAELDRQHYDNKNRYLPDALKLPQADNELLGAPWPAELAAAVTALRPSQDGATLRLVSADATAAEGAVVLPDPAHWTDIAWLTTPWNPAATPQVVCDTLAARLQ